MGVLRQLPAVESQLSGRSMLARRYAATLALYVVGALRRYHSALVLNPSDVVAVFDLLSKVRQVFHTFHVTWDGCQQTFLYSFNVYS